MRAEWWMRPFLFPFPGPRLSLYLGNPRWNVLTRSAFFLPVSPVSYVGKKGGLYCTVKKRDAFGWWILWLKPRAIPGCLANVLRWPFRPESEIILRGYEDRISFTRGCSSLGLPSFPAWLGARLPLPDSSLATSRPSKDLCQPVKSCFPQFILGLLLAYQPHKPIPETMSVSDQSFSQAVNPGRLVRVASTSSHLSSFFILHWGNVFCCFGSVCGVLFCFRLGLIVEASNHSAKTVLAASFLARDFMGAQGKKKMALDLLCGGVRAKPGEHHKLCCWGVRFPRTWIHLLPLLWRP